MNIHPPPTDPSPLQHFRPTFHPRQTPSYRRPMIGCHFRTQGANWHCRLDRTATTGTVRQFNGWQCERSWPLCRNTSNRPSYQHSSNPILDAVTQHLGSKPTVTDKLSEGSRPRISPQGDGFESTQHHVLVWNPQNNYRQRAQSSSVKYLVFASRLILIPSVCTSPQIKKGAAK